MSLLLCLLVASLAVTPSMAQGDTDTQANSSIAEIIATRGLCSFFGGDCGFVCPHRYLRHRWDIPLCLLSNQECCLGPAPEDANATVFTTTTTTTVITTPAPEYDICGVLPSGSSRKKRIVGGHTAAQGSWPWLVALRNFMGGISCSGAVIAQRWVVTAAHCFRFAADPNMWRVRIGEHDLFTNEDNERDLRIQHIYVHPQHSSQSPDSSSNSTLYSRFLYDIALLQLAEDSRIEPVCLPTLQRSNEDSELSNVISETPSVQGVETDFSDNPRFGPTMRRSLNLQAENEIPEGVDVVGAGRRSIQNGGNCWVAGWGATLDASIQDQILREVSGDIIPRDQCSRLWGLDLPENMICFGDGSFGPCAGDSGAPMSCERNGQFYLAGVVSWGAEACNVTGRPSVFTRTGPFLNWMEDIMSRDQ
ncbi:elastase-1-like [Biomphalaria glabrata]|uniref:Elastase-1-like n=1 Tax=Biomphalaria glabrata TaxID=6526 RepID=A0A9W3A7U9_BIOGL|nr:elastase-1-like [Biomphalaria glabrata]